jgi:hypothetical protein
MPTKRRRHMITETAEIEMALEPLRARGVSVTLPELVIKGAKTTLAEVQAAADDADHNRAARERFLERARTGAGLDPDILLDPRRPAWKRPEVDELLEEP